MAIQTKLSLDKIRSQLGMVNSVQDPIMRGQKLAQISAEITAAAMGIKAPPFRKSSLASAIASANPEPKKGVAVPIKEKLERRTQPQRKLKGLSRVGNVMQKGTESFAEWLAPEQGEEFIKSNIILSSVRGAGRLARKAAAMANSSSSGRAVAMRKAANERLKEIEKARELAMQKPAQASSSDLLAALEKAEVPKKLDLIIKLLQESKEAQSGSTKDALSGARGGKPGLPRGGKAGRLLNILKGAATLKNVGRFALGAFRIARMATPVGLALTAGYYGIKAISESLKSQTSTSKNNPSGSSPSDTGSASTDTRKVENVGPGQLGLEDPIAQFVAKGEGVRLKAYSDSGGYPTIGVGHLITKDEIRRGFIDTGTGDPIKIDKSRITNTVATKEQVKALFENIDLPKHAAIARRQLGDEAWAKLNVPQQATVISYAFNRGTLAGLIKRGLKDAIMTGNVQKAADIIANGVRTSGGKFVPGLVNRRNEEARAFKNGFGKNSKTASSGASRPGAGTVLKSEAPKPVTAATSNSAKEQATRNAMDVLSSPSPQVRTVEKQPVVVQQAPQAQQKAPQGVQKTPMAPTRNPPSSLQRTQQAESYRML